MKEKNTLLLNLKETNSSNQFLICIEGTVWQYMNYIRAYYFYYYYELEIWFMPWVKILLRFPYKGRCFMWLILFSRREKKRFVWKMIFFKRALWWPTVSKQATNPCKYFFQIFTGNRDRNHYTMNYLGKYSFHATAVRIYPLKWHGNMALRMELYGC